MENSNTENNIVLIKHPTDDALVIRAEFEVVNSSIEVNYVVVNKETNELIEDSGPEVDKQVTDFANEVVASITEMFEAYTSAGND